MAAKDYKKRLENLKSRRQDILTKAFSVTESFNKNSYGDTITYVLESMQPIDSAYTANTYKACEKVQGHIKPGLAEKGILVEFRYQGSVPLDTHIKLYSDIDLLVINTEFIGVPLMSKIEPPYILFQGNATDELKIMRQEIFKILDTVYSTAKIDDSGSKALNISGGSLGRSIDIISSNWYDSDIYVSTLNEINRGIQILNWDKKNHSSNRILNFPFLHIYMINVKDKLVNGNLKKMIRFLKTLKVDAEQSIKISSYDIASLVYQMDSSLLKVSESKTLVLLENCHTFFEKIANDESFRNRLEVPNGTRKIFSTDGAQLAEFLKLKSELKDVVNDILKDVKPLFETLQNKDVYYKMRL